jgi:hypothetical protein
MYISFKVTQYYKLNLGKMLRKVKFTEMGKKDENKMKKREGRHGRK